MNPKKSKTEELNYLLNRPGPSTVESSTLESAPLESRHYDQHSTMRRLRFDDIALAFKKFHGDLSLSINSWIRDFETNSQIFNLSELEKLVYTKRLMNGIAALFIQFESKATSYEELKNELLEEYGSGTNSALIHERMKARKKKDDETNIEYLYHMMSIASETEMDTQGIITHVTNGLQGQAEAKAFMFEAKTLKEFKAKLKSFEAHQQSTGECDAKNKKNEDPKMCELRYSISHHY